MDNNPYQAPPINSATVTPRTSSAPVPESFVDGDALIVASGSVLPEICIKTNQPVSPKDMKKLTVTWCPSWVIGFLFLAGPFGLLVAYLATQKRCTLTIGLRADIRKRYRNRVLIKSAIAFALFMILLFSFTLESPELSLTLLVFFLISIVVAGLGNSPISVKNYRDGAFWVRGFNKEFLMGLLE